MSAMWTDLTHLDISVLDKIIRTVVVYWALIVLLRLAGKRDLAQLNSFDLIVMLLLSNVVQNAIIGPDNSLLGGLIGATVLIAANAFLVRVVRPNRRVTALLEGTNDRARPRRPLDSRTHAPRGRGTAERHGGGAAPAERLQDRRRRPGQARARRHDRGRPPSRSWSRRPRPTSSGLEARSWTGCSAGRWRQRIAPGVYAAASGWRATTASTRRTTAWVCERAAPVNSIGSRDQRGDRGPVEAEPRVGGEPVEEVVVGRGPGASRARPRRRAP